MPEWQQGVVRGHLDVATTRVGSKCTTIRRIGGHEREVITEITEYDPPIAMREDTCRRIWVVFLFARDTRRMKIQATIVISYRADSLGDAGGALDDVLGRAREREDVEVDRIQLGTPVSAGPVTLPSVERPPAPPQRVPHPLPNGERA
jgi:hypothetical protein